MSKLNVTKTILSISLMSLCLVACDGRVKIDSDGVDIKVGKDTEKVTSTTIGHYTAYSDGTAVDNDTDMMWARCSIGQEWDNDSLTCTGEAEKYTWESAIKSRKLSWL